MSGTLTPPDLKCCQAEKPGNGPFTIGGAIGNPKNGYRVRCDAVPTVIVTEREPGDDGLCGSMSLCDGCHGEFQKMFGVDSRDVFTTALKLEPEPDA